MSSSEVEDDYAKIDYSSKLRAHNLAPRINEGTSVRRQEKTEFEELEQFVREEKKKPNFESTNRCTKVSTIKWGLLILFILLTCTLAILFSLFYLWVKLKQEVNGQKDQIQCLNYTINLLSNNGSELAKKVDEQKGIIDRQGDEINRLKNKISELAPEHTSVMLTGGWDNNRGIIASTAIYNSVKKNWTTCKLTLPHELANHGAAVLNNEIYIFGGYANGMGNNPFNTVYKLGANNEWKKMASMIENRSSISQSSLVFNSEIWVIGGWHGTNILKSVEKYNPKTNSWTKMPYAAAASVIDGKIYVSGGVLEALTMEVYDPAKNQWDYFPASLSYRLTDHCSIADGRNLMIIGGKKDGDTFSNEVWKIDITDPEKEWIQMASFNQKRIYHGAVKLKDGLMIFGGMQNDSTTLNSVEIFNGTNWSEGPSLPEKVGKFAFIPLTREQEKVFLKRFCTIQ